MEVKYTKDYVLNNKIVIDHSNQEQLDFLNKVFACSCKKYDPEYPYFIPHLSGGGNSVRYRVSDWKVVISATLFIADNQPAAITDVAALADNTRNPEPGFVWTDVLVAKFTIQDAHLSIEERLRKFKMIKQDEQRVPAFTTYDGVQVFDGDDYEYVSSDWEIKPCTAIAKDSEYSITCRSNGGEYFSTREAAEEYVRLNKPCLSVQQVVDGIKETKNSIELYNKLKSLVTL